MTFGSDVRSRPNRVACVATRLAGYVDGAKMTALANQIQTLHGVKLMGTGVAGEVVHGHLSSISKPAGDPFAKYTAVDGTVIFEDTCPFCDLAIPRANAHGCTEIVLYTSGEAPNGDHATTLAPHGLSPAALAAIAALRTDILA